MSQEKPKIKKELGFSKNSEILLAFSLGYAKGDIEIPKRKKARIIFS